MAIPKQPSNNTLFFLLLATLMVTLSFPITNASDCIGAGNITVYWGQGTYDQNEGTLQSACATGNYNIVILDHLIVHDDGSTPELNLASHCTGEGCIKLEQEIEFCQQNNVKVFLSIGQDAQSTSPKTATNHGHSVAISEDAATKLAKYLVDNFLNGQKGPLGSVTLDGIDFADVADGTNLKWSQVVEAIKEAISTLDTKVYLSASPQCNREIPDYLDDPIKTGDFDYLWVEFFYQNPNCIYSNGDPSKLLSEWDEWTKAIPKSLIFLGLVGTDKAYIPGYIPPKALTSDVLPVVKKASNYGGVMIYNRYYDKTNDYSTQIKDSVGRVCRCVCDGDEGFASKGFYGLHSSASMPLSM